MIFSFEAIYTRIDAVQSITINATRLGAANQYELVVLLGPTGAVEVFVVEYDSWLPVCSTSWDTNAESQVLCRQIGFNVTGNFIEWLLDIV